MKNQKKKQTVNKDLDIIKNDHTFDDHGKPMPVMKIKGDRLPSLTARHPNANLTALTVDKESEFNK